MSRNLGIRHCDYCTQDYVVITGPIFNFEERYSFYVSEYRGMKVADAECQYCGTKYLAWVEPSPNKRKEWMDPDWAPEKRYYDLSYRSTFNDEPGKSDLPTIKPLTPLELKQQLAQRDADIERLSSNPEFKVSEDIELFPIQPGPIKFDTLTNCEDVPDNKVLVDRALLVSIKEQLEDYRMCQLSNHQGLVDNETNESIVLLKESLAGCT